MNKNTPSVFFIIQNIKIGKMLAPEEIPELKKAVEEQFSRGYSRRHIMAAMKKAGFSEEEINQVIGNGDKKQEVTTSKRGPSPIKAILAVIIIVAIAGFFLLNQSSEISEDSEPESLIGRNESGTPVTPETTNELGCSLEGKDLPTCVPDNIDGRVLAEYHSTDDWLEQGTHYPRMLCNDSRVKGVAGLRLFKDGLYAGGIIIFSGPDLTLQELWETSQAGFEEDRRVPFTATSNRTIKGLETRYYVTHTSDYGSYTGTLVFKLEDYVIAVNTESQSFSETMDELFELTTDYLDTICYCTPRSVSEIKSSLPDLNQYYPPNLTDEIVSGIQSAMTGLLVRTQYLSFNEGGQSLTILEINEELPDVELMFHCSGQVCGQVGKITVSDGIITARDAVEFQIGIECQENTCHLVVMDPDSSLDAALRSIPHPTVMPIPIDTGLCSNSDYSTEQSVRGVQLSYRSRRELEEAIEKEDDSALQGISDLTCLEYLDLSDMDLSDISPLNNLVDLKELDLRNTRVSDVYYLSTLVKLEKLDLQGTDVSDIHYLRYLENLEELNLKDTDVSDVSPLDTLINLEELNLEDTQVSYEDCEELKEELPQARIYCPPAPEPPPTVYEQRISLNEGWNLIGFNVNKCWYVGGKPTIFIPGGVEYEKVSSLSEVFSSIDGKYEIVWAVPNDEPSTPDGEIGKFYNPTQEDNSTLDYFAVGHAYWISMEERGTLVLEGESKIDPKTPLPLREGWNHIAYLHDEEMPVEEAFESIEDNLISVWGYKGDHEWERYIPNLPPAFSNFDTLKPNHGYAISVDADVTWILPL